MPASVIHLKSVLQPFPYGRTGDSSLAAQYVLAANPTAVSIKPNQSYGEMWIGSTHPNGPSKVFGSNKQLKDIIAENPEWYLGQTAANMKPYKDGLWLPYLFKVLSFDKALPLQAHPDRDTATKLHQHDEIIGDENFVDSNHKPECCVALTPFQAFIGFRPLQEITSLIGSSTALSFVFPSSIFSQLAEAKEDASQRAALKAAFSFLIKHRGVESLVSAISDEVKAKGGDAFGSVGRRDGLAQVWTKNLETYGKDVGLLVTTFLMNFVKLAPGEGSWILADDIHAYVEGECIECMANSDNMVAHGLGEGEMGGVQTLVDMLSYRHLPPSAFKLVYEDSWPIGQHGKTRLYKVPFSEFDLLRVSLPALGDVERLQIQGPLELLVGEGAVKLNADTDVLNLERGGSVFIAAGRVVELVATKECTIVWGAFVQ